MPTIAELLKAYRDRTGASYEEMARKVGDEITRSRMHQLTTNPPREFPKHPRTIELLSELLQVPVTTTLMAFAAGLGLPVSSSSTLLADTLPPGADTLTPEDREAIRAVTKALIDARNAAVHVGPGSGKTEQVAQLLDLARPPLPDLSQVAARRGQSEGRRLREAQDLETDKSQDSSHE